MNAVDAFLFAIIAVSAGFGWYRGLILGVLDLTRWIASIVSGFLFYEPAAAILAGFTGWDASWNEPAAFILLVIGSALALQIGGALLIRQLDKDIHRHPLNRIIGILPGTISGLAIGSITAAILFALPYGNGLHNSLRESRLAEPLAIFSDELESILTPIFEDAVNETLTRRLTVYPGSDESVELPFSIEDASPRPDLEAKMLVLINEERTREGLDPLEPDPEMRVVARSHSDDMFERGYFAHRTPEDKDPFDRMRAAKVRFKVAGENLALAPTLKIAHLGLMNSPGHRANILRPTFGRVGIGVLDGGRRGLMITQKFRN